MFQSLLGYRTHLHFTNVASEFVLGRGLVPRFRRVYRYGLKKKTVTDLRLMKILIGRIPTGEDIPFENYLL